MNVVDSRNFFAASLAVAVVGHLLFFECFLLVVPFKNMPRAKGVAFLGSILDSSQMERMPLLRRNMEKEQTVFSRHIPPRSEGEYFKSLKDITKPEISARGRKKDVKSLFPSVRRSSAQSSQWHVGEAVEYQPLTFKDSP